MSKLVEFGKNGVVITKRTVFVRPTDGMTITLKPYAPPLAGETEDDYLKRVHELTIAKWIRDGKLPPGDYPCVVIEHAEIPTDRSYRNAWTFKDKAFGHDMAKAKEVHRAKVRHARQPLLEAQDMQFMRALETGADTTAIAAEKKRLRDAPADPRIDAAKTIEELKAAWPL